MTRPVAESSSTLVPLSMYEKGTPKLLAASIADSAICAPVLYTCSISFSRNTRRRVK